MDCPYSQLSCLLEFMYAYGCVFFFYKVNAHNWQHYIGGATLHSWSELVWQDRRGRQIKSHGNSEDKSKS